jgi:hypothetical protein
MTFQTANILAPTILGTQPEQLQLFVDFVRDLKKLSNTETAAAEAARLSPYFDAMSAYIADSFQKSHRRGLGETRTGAGLAKVFNGVAAVRHNTLISDVTILPVSAVTEGPAAVLFNEKINFSVPQQHGGFVFNFGFLEVFHDNGGKAPVGSTTLPVFLIDDRALAALEPEKAGPLMAAFKTVFNFQNHDALHHFTSAMVTDIIAHAFESKDETPFEDWRETMYQYGSYEDWAHATHEHILLEGAPQQLKAIENAVTTYFAELPEAVTGNTAQERRAYIDYFGTLMLQTLARVFPLNHPMVTHGLSCLEKIDPMPERAYDDACGAWKSPGLDPAVLREVIRKNGDANHIISEYEHHHFKFDPATYAGAKLLQMLALSADDSTNHMRPHIPEIRGGYHSLLHTRAPVFLPTMIEVAAKMAGIDAKPVEYIPEEERPAEKIDAFSSRFSDFLFPEPEPGLAYSLKKVLRRPE